MKKGILLFGLVIVMMAFIGIPSLASSDDPSMTTFLETFDLTDEDLEFVTSQSVYPEFVEYYYLDQSESESNNVFGDFVFSSGLERLKISSFACEKRLIGYGQEGTTIGLMVYKNTENGKEVIDSNIRVLGASGLYSDQIVFDYDQQQYLLVVVKENDTVYTKVFEVTTKHESTKKILENIEINFIEEEENVMPKFDLPMNSGYELDW